MSRINLVLLAFFLTFVFQGCSQILEPVLFNSGLKSDVEDQQEQFEVNIRALTFNAAKKANNTPYPRRLMLTGAGVKADVFDEDIFLKTNIPKLLDHSDYKLRQGDTLDFLLLPGFINDLVQLPVDDGISEYLMGVGDELTLTQIVDNISVNETLMLKDDKSTEKLLQTSGIIGTNGNILLIGVGNIKAIGRSINDLRDEVRNIYIRSGYPPTFQLEITGFNSKKAYTTILDMYNGAKTDSGKQGDTININNVSVNLQEIALSEGVSGAFDSNALITLTRNGKRYRLTAEQLFDKNTPRIIIKDKDQIEFELSVSKTSSTGVVDAKGDIILPVVGKVKAIGQTVSELRDRIANILLQKRLNPSFTLEMIESQTQKVYIVKGGDSKTIPLTDKQITLKEIIIANKLFSGNENGLSVITLKRNKKSYRITVEFLLDVNSPDIFVQSEDQIEIEELEYKPNKIFALSGAGSARIVEINPSKRETLADILFVQQGAFQNRLAKRSEVYLLRAGNPSVAYHLDAQNVSRILVAAKTELRPNDIIYVADRPIISFTRLLSEISPLRTLLRDLENGNIP